VHVNSSFFPGCLWHHLHDSAGNTCPHVGCDVKVLNLEASIKCDNTIQGVVDKLFPALAKIDAEQEVAFYLKHNIPRKSDVKRLRSDGKMPLRKDVTASANSRVDIFVEPFIKGGDLVALPLPFLRTHSKLQMVKLMDYIHRKLELQAHEKICLMAKDVELTDGDVSLGLVIAEHWKNDPENATIKYRRKCD
jgi:hypothetical protein